MLSSRNEGLYSPSNNQCGCVQSSFELNASLSYDRQCQCSLNKPCSDSEEWQILAVSHVIDLIDTEVGMLLFEKNY